MNAMRGLWLAGIGGLANGLVPILGLIMLTTWDYARFSIVYLIFAIGWSLSLSVVCDAWLRTGAQAKDWARFRWAQLQLASVAGVVGGVAALVLIGNLASALLAGAAVAANVYRLGARYQSTVNDGPARAHLSDLATVAALAATIGVALFAAGAMNAEQIILAWAVGNVIGALPLLVGRYARTYSLVSWVRRRRRVIVPLVSDSGLMDLGSSWAPLAMSLFMIPTAFGLYRAVSSVATPVQLVLDPLRPVIAHQPPARMANGLGMAKIGGMGLVMALCCYAALVLVVGPLRIGGETLVALTEFAVPTSLFVLSNFLGYSYYISARGHAPVRQLMIGRILQMAVTIVGPAAGLGMFGLPGAIWGFSASTCISALAWLVIVRWLAGSNGDRLTAQGSSSAALPS